MKTNRIILAGLCVLSIWGCKKKSEDNSTPDTTTVTPSVNLSGSIDTIRSNGQPIKVNLKAGTHYLASNIYVNPGDTFQAQPGAKIIALGNYAITVRGVFYSVGAQGNPVEFTVPDNKKLISNNGLPAGEGGIWGGLNLDSATTVVVMKWTKVEYVGGPDKTLSPRLGISCKRSKSIDIEDSWIRYTYDDGIRIHGTHNCIVKRNTFEHCGGTNNGGEALNIKQGATGDVSYNVFWNSATKSVKLETDAVVTQPQTQWNIYNNTFLNTGFRNNAKPGPGTSVDLNSQANIYNNLYINCLRGIAIFQQADAPNVYYDNNLFSSTDVNVDSSGEAGAAYFTLPLNKYYYDTTDKAVWGNPSVGPLKVRNHDIRVPVVSASNQTIIKNLRNFTSDYAQYDWLPNGSASPYDPNLKTNSPAIGKGVTTTNWFALYNLSISPTPGSDIGAIQTSGNLGNRHY